MRFFNIAALGAAAVVLPRAGGFVSPAGFLLSAPGRTLQHATTRATATMSYADKLRQAQEAKALASGQGSPVPPASSQAAPVSDVGGGVPLPAIAESPFSPLIQEELRTAITILSARLQREKPMSRTEFERFESAVAVIVEDALPRQELPDQVAVAAVAPPTPPAPYSTPASPSSTTMDELESEGPKWDPKVAVQYGLPVGVRNSYVIDDMAKMTPEEYQEALRQKVISRAQSARQTGSYGNIVSNEYLKFLGKNPKTGDPTYKSNEKFVGDKGNEAFDSY